MRSTFTGSKKMIWTGRVLSLLISLLLLMDAAMKIMKAQAAMEGTVRLGYPAEVIPGVGVTLLVATVLYMLPPTSVFGAILITGYMGGAVATNLRVGNAWLGYTLFPVYVGILAWGGLFLRDERLRMLIPIRKTQPY